MNKAPSFRCFIVEDEPLAAQSLSLLVAEEPDLELVGAARSGVDAVDGINREKPDVLFLDVHIPNFSGVEVLRRVHASAMHVIFTTAHDRYAVTAFELGAIDYLLKPFGRKEFKRALDRARKFNRQSADSLLDRTRMLDPKKQETLDRVYVRAGSRIIPVVIDDIAQLTSDDGFTALHTPDNVYYLDVPLKEIEQQLDPDMFVRVRRSAIINLKRIKTVQRGGDRRLHITLSDGGDVIASRRHSKALRRLFKPLAADKDQ